MNLANPLKKVNIDDLAVAVPLGLALLIAMTNLEGSAGTVFLYAAVACALVFPTKVGMGVLWVNILYLGFSYISLKHTGVTNTRFLHLCAFAVTLRALPELLASLRKNRGYALSARAGLPVLLMGYIALSCWRTSNLEFVNNLFVGAAVLLMARELRKPEGARIAAWQLIALIFSIYLYFLLQSGVYEKRSARFPGVRDANNFALYSNIALVLFNSYCRDVPRKLRIALNSLLIFGIFITVSVSGLAVLAVIGVFYMPKKGWIPKAVLGTAAGMAAVGLLLYWIAPDFLSRLGGFPARGVAILDALGEGDLNAATTGRYKLWEYYWDVFRSRPRAEMLFGNKELIASRLVKGVLSPHNTYLNLLLDYGFVGLGLVTATAASRIWEHIRRKEYPWLLLAGIMLLNMCFRSMSGISLYLFIIL